MTQFSRLTPAEGLELAPGVQMAPLFGDAAMLNLIDLEPGARVTLHSHPHEQLGIVLRGTLVLEVDGKEHRLGPDDAYQLTGDTPHAASAGPDGCRVLDLFQPVREDYRERWEAR